MIIELDGEDLVLQSVHLNGEPLSEGFDYELTSDGMTLKTLPLSRYTYSLV